MKDDWWKFQTSHDNIERPCPKKLETKKAELFKPHFCAVSQYIAVQSQDTDEEAKVQRDEATFL